MSTPPITITRLDLQRLERLLDGLDEFGPAAEALEAELSRAQVVGHDEIPPGVVTMNSTVRCREESSAVPTGARIETLPSPATSSG